jgi:hypothetical protein
MLLELYTEILMNLKYSTLKNDYFISFYILNIALSFSSLIKSDSLF